MAKIKASADRRKGTPRRQTDAEAAAAIESMLADHHTQFTQIIERIDCEWVQIERLKAETREILHQLQAA